MKIRRIGAYGVCRDRDGRVLLARNSGLSGFPGQWTLPGGGVDQGEHPDDAVVREFAEETGLSVRIDGLRDVGADVRRQPNGDLEHTDRIIYDVSVAGGELWPEASGTTVAVSWVSEPDLSVLPLMPFTARALGLAYPGSDISDISDVEPPRASRRQRFAAYAAATGPDGRILLAKIAEGYPGAGLWHLPGGGTDHGESPQEALARELFEETSQHGRVTGLLGVSHRHDTSAVGPEGVPIDWHGVRVVYRVVVDTPAPAVVSEQAGSTGEAAWFSPAEIPGLELTEAAREAVAGIEAEGLSRLPER